MSGPTTPTMQARSVWADPRSLATTRGMISFPPGTKMFQFPGLPSQSLCVQLRDTAGSPAAGFPIRKSSDQNLFTVTRGLSQCPTSFIGTWRQGIHRKPLVASPRDTEKLILFGLQNIFTIFFRIIYSSVTIQLVRCCSPLTGERCAQLLFRASLALQPALFFDKKTRLIAGHEKA